MKSDALRIAQMQHKDGQVKAVRDILIAYEPLITIVGSAAALGMLEKTYYGPPGHNDQLISTNQKRVLLAGVIAVEVARSGLITQVATGVEGVAGAIGHATQDIGGVVTPLLGGM